LITGWYHFFFFVNHNFENYINIDWCHFCSLFFPQPQADRLHKLWTEFLQLYNILCSKTPLIQGQISEFEKAARKWVQDLYSPFPGSANNHKTLVWYYTKKDVTPYMHAFANHYPDQMKLLSRFGLTHRLFSAAPVEKKNHVQVTTFFRSTRMDGGGGKASKGQGRTTSAVTEIMEHENRQLFYILHDIPNSVPKTFMYNFDKTKMYKNTVTLPMTTPSPTTPSTPHNDKS
jgi:hypothetical protein